MNNYTAPLWISLKTVLATTAITFVLGIAAARWISRYSGRLKPVIDGIFILPLVLPPTVVGFGLLLFMGKHGWGGKFLALFNTFIVFSWPATVVAAAVMAFPLMYMTTRGAFEQVDTNIENAARTLGASEWKVLYSVTLPLAWPGVLAGTILSFARALGEFGATLMIAGNIPGKTATIPVAIYFDIVDGNMKQADILIIIVMGIALTSLALLAYLKRSKPRSRSVVANTVPSDILAAGKKIDNSS